MFDHRKSTLDSRWSSCVSCELNTCLKLYSNSVFQRKRFNQKHPYTRTYLQIHTNLKCTEMKLPLFPWRSLFYFQLCSWLGGPAPVTLSVCSTGSKLKKKKSQTPAVINSSEIWNLKWKPQGFSTDCWSTGCHWSPSMLSTQLMTSIQKTKQRREDGSGSREEISGLVQLSCLQNAFQMHPAFPYCYHLDFDTIHTPSVPLPGVGWKTATAV